KNHLVRVPVRRADEESRGDVIPPLNPPVWMAGRLRPEEVRDAGGEGPRLRRGQASVEQPLDHKVSSGVASVCWKLQGQFLGRGHFHEGRAGLLWLDGNRSPVRRHAAAPEPPGHPRRTENYTGSCTFPGSPDP